MVDLLDEPPIYDDKGNLLFPSSINIHSDDKSGDDPAFIKAKDPQDSVVLLEDKFTQQYQEAIDRRYRDLPAVQQSDANINFLGSSYSGSDIKVIVHMYDEVNWSDQKKADLQLKKDISDAIVGGCDNLINGGFVRLTEPGGESIDYTKRRDLFIKASLGDIDSDAKVEASKILVNSIFKAGEGFSFLEIAKMQRVADSIRTQHVSLVNEYVSELKNLEGDKKSSSSTIVLGTLQTISVQSFREKNAVRALGHSYAKGYTRGTRTIGGSCIFTIFNEHALANLIHRLGPYNPGNAGERDAELTTLLPDQLPPLDVTILFANEYGSLSDFRLYGLEFFTDGSVFSIEDLLSEQTMNFICRDADIMTPRGRIRISRLQRGMFNGKDDKDLSASNLLFDNAAYEEYLNKLGVRRRLTNR